MSGCITLHEFQRLIAEQSSLAERKALDAHLEACVHCQETLARLLDEPAEDLAGADWQLRRGVATASTVKLPENFLRRLKEQLPNRLRAAGGVSDNGGATDILFPGPPTPRGPLGQLESYHIVAELGRGAFGLVFKAHDEKLNCLVAIKVLRPELAASTADRARFEGEARKAAAVRHDHIVTVHRVGSTPGFALPYFVMEYIEGEAVNDRLRRQGTLGAWEAADITRQVALGLAAAHACGLVHRDIKPSNILLERASGRAKITDFGLARTFDVRTEKLTQSGGIVGTPPYMSPEQIVSPQQLDPRSDVYSLGAVLHELLTGEPPFRGLTHLVLEQIVHEEPRALRRLNDTVPRDLETICLHCLQKKPGQRYASAAALAEDLRRFLAREPILARPVRGWERAVKWTRRRPAIASLIALVVLVTTLGFGLVTWQWRRAELAWEKSAAQATDLEARAEELQDKNYTQNIALAGNELASGNLGRAEELLDECPEGLRRWEWHYLKRLRHAPPLTLRLEQGLGGHRGFDVTFSPNGSRLAAPSGKKDVKIWDASTGQEVRTLSGHQDRVLRVAFSPDGGRLASASKDHTVRVWDTATGRELFTLPGHERTVHGVAFSPNGQFLASASLDQSVKLWDAATGAPLHDFPASFTETIFVTLAFSPDSRLLAAPGVDYTAKIWDVFSGQEVATLSGHTDQVFSAAFSPDGQTLVTAGWEGSVKGWDLGSGKQGTLSPRFSVDDVSHSAWCMALSADGRLLAVAGTAVDETARVYDTLSGENLFTLRGHNSRVVSVAFSPDGRRLASGGHDKTVKLWDLKSGDEVLTLREHKNLVGHVLFDPTGQRLASSGEDGMVWMWDSTPLEEDSRIRTLHGHEGVVQSLAFSPDRRYLASAGGDQTVRVWEMATGREVWVLRGHRGPVNSVAFSPKGRRLASASEDKTLRLWDAETGREIICLRDFRGGVRCVAFSHDGARLATTDATDNVQVWDAAIGRELLPRPRGHKAYVKFVTFSNDGKFIATSSVDGTVKLWDATTHREVHTFPHTTGVMSVALSPDPHSRLLASGDMGRLVRVWETGTREELFNLPGHISYALAMAFSPDGRRLASASSHEVIVWDTITRRKIRTLSGFTGAIKGVAFSPDGQRLAACGGYKAKGEIKIWDRTLWDTPADK